MAQILSFMLMLYLFLMSTQALCAEPHTVLRRTGLVSYAEEYELVPYNNGVITQMHLIPGEKIQDGAEMYRINRLEPGYAEVVAHNSFGAKIVTNVYIKKGMYAQKGTVLAKLASSNSYKIVLKLLSDELAQFISAKQRQIELFPNTETPVYLNISKHRIYNPGTSDPFFKIEVMFDCNYQRCPNFPLVGNVADVISTSLSQNSDSLINKAATASLNTTHQ